jgi:hypothetical protein
MRNDIVAIDTPVSGSTDTLRQAIMSIPATTGNISTPLVFSIDRRWKQPADVLLSSKYTRGWPPDCQVPDPHPHSFFTPRALLEEGKDLLFGPITGTVSSIANRNLAYIFDGDDDMSTIQLLAPAGHQDTTQIFGQRMTSALT